MSVVFLKLLNMSIAAGWLILAVIVLRLLLRKMPRLLSCILWVIVAVRLSCPFLPESSFSLIPSAEPVSLSALRSVSEPTADSRQNPGVNGGAVVITEMPKQQEYGEAAVMTEMPKQQEYGEAAVMTEMPKQQEYGEAAVMTEMPKQQEYGGTTVMDDISKHQENSETPVPVGMLNAQENGGKTAMGDVPNTQIDSVSSVAGNTPENLDSSVLSAATSGNRVSSPDVWMNVGSMIWIAGLAVMLGYACFSFLRLRKKVQVAVRLRDNIWFCDGVKSPFILGVIRPKIYLPSGIGVSSGIQEEQIRYILAHEEAHLKRRDHWWKILGYLLLAVYWFHPLVWAAYILFCRDIELACDEKVIKDMNMEEKKLYSNTLVACSVRRKMVAACPLAFGEIGVKKRVRTVLNYKKPAFWAVAVAICACAAVALCFLTNPRRDTFDIKIVIPANSGQAFYYSDEEISPYRNSVILQSGEGMGDTEVVLKPMEGITKEDAYADLTSYMTPGLSVKMYAQKGGWFRVGVMMENTTDKDIVVYVRVKGVTVRIANYVSNENGVSGSNMDSETAEGDSGVFEESDPPFGEQISIGAVSVLPNRKEPTTGVNALLHLQGSELEAVTAAIMEANAQSWPENYDFECCDFVLLDTLFGCPLPGSTTHIITYYGWAMDQKYNISDKGIEDLGGSHIPVAITFTLDENGYELQEYWQPREGSYFVTDIRDKFPPQIADDGINSQKSVLDQTQSCYKQVVMAYGLDTDAVIGGLLDTICSEPGISSNPRDYIDAHSIEYRELLYYGEYTLRYCFARFEQGNETGLEGSIMALVCEEILQTKGAFPADADTAGTGQLWYEALQAHAGSRIEQYLE